jgi:hypothetical protein
MLIVDLNAASTFARYEGLAQLAASIESVRQTQGSRPALDYLLNGIGLHPSPIYNDSYFSEALDYHLALLYAHLDKPERASTYIERAHVLPSAGGDQLFSEQIRESLELHRQMIEARERGLPSILLSSMPRSASASLTQSLSATIGAPILRTSIGHFPSYYVVRHWLNGISPGGAITHDHFGASPFNINILTETGCREVFVLVRDPRASAASRIVKMPDLERDKSLIDYTEQRIVRGALDTFYPWLASWMTASQSSGLRVHWLQSKDVRNDMAGTITSMLENFHFLYPAVNQFLSPPKEVKANFIAGDDDAWRSVVSSAGQKRLWDELPPGAAELLGLQP